MGMPACRISDATAHGGIITVGFPQVLIGNLPASRIGDLHVCPMVTVLVPHVGGPFILGSPTVLVGMMPQSRVTDMLTCVGPPDTAILGEFTVLVGMAGAGGAAGASAGVADMGAPVAGAPPAAGTAGTSPQPKAEQQPDGTVKTSAPPGESLPPVKLQQEGWPDLPPENTATFQSVQPANVLPGTTLYATADADSTGANSYWSADPPAPGSAAATDLNAATHVLVHTVPPGDGVKAWAGQGSDTGKLQLWTPPGAISAGASQRFRLQGTAS